MSTGASYEQAMSKLAMKPQDVSGTLLLRRTYLPKRAQRRHGWLVRRGPDHCLVRYSVLVGEGELTGDTSAYRGLAVPPYQTSIAGVSIVCCSSTVAARKSTSAITQSAPRMVNLPHALSIPTNHISKHDESWLRCLIL